MKKAALWLLFDEGIWPTMLLAVILVCAVVFGTWNASAQSHEGQPDHCSNAKTAPAAHKCECKKTEDACDVEDKTCKVYCRKDHCHCFHPACDS